MRAIIDGQAGELPFLRIVLRDGTVGWYQRENLDCLRTAAATAAEISYEDVPQMILRSEFEAWAATRGLTVCEHRRPPEGRWIGVSPLVEGSLRHVVVGIGEHVIHDPAQGWIFSGDRRAEPVTELEYAISLENA